MAEGIQLISKIVPKNDAFTGLVDATQVIGLSEAAPFTAREMEDAWKSAYVNYKVEFTYSEGTLTDIDIYTVEGTPVKLFNKHFTYTEGLITSIVTTRESDSLTLTKTFAYDAEDALISITADVA